MIRYLGDASKLLRLGHDERICQKVMTDSDDSERRDSGGDRNS